MVSPNFVLFYREVLMLFKVSTFPKMKTGYLEMLVKLGRKCVLLSALSNFKHLEQSI